METSIINFFATLWIFLCDCVQCWLSPLYAQMVKIKLVFIVSLYFDVMWWISDVKLKIYILCSIFCTPKYIGIPLSLLFGYYLLVAHINVTTVCSIAFTISLVSADGNLLNINLQYENDSPACRLSLQISPCQYRKCAISVMYFCRNFG